MNRKFFFLIPLIAVVFSAFHFADAQSDMASLPEAQRIELTTSDEVTLVGDFYTDADSLEATVVLLHGQAGNRADWQALLDPLWDARYQILAVDLRGYGESGGDANWQTIADDVQLWLDWLYEQPQVQTDGVSIVGADLGANVAAIACENDSQCLTAIALSPIGLGCADRDCSAEAVALDDETLALIDATTTATLSDDERRTPTLVVSAREDVSMQSIRAIGPTRSERVEVGVAFGAGHGAALLDASDEQDRVVRWLDARTPPNLTDAEIEALVADGDPENGEVLFETIPDGITTETGHICTHCHTVDSEEHEYGPGFYSIANRAGSRVEGQSAAVYLYYAIVTPDNFIVDGFASDSMQWQYGRFLTENEVADLVAYLLTLTGDQ